MRLVARSFVVAAAVGALSGTAFAAQAKPAEKKPAAAKQMATKPAKAAVITANGTVSKFDAASSTLTVTTSKGDTSFVLGPGATVMADGKTAAANESREPRRSESHGPVHRVGRSEDGAVGARLGQRQGGLREEGGSGEEVVAQDAPAPAQTGTPKQPRRREAHEDCCPVFADLVLFVAVVSLRPAIRPARWRARWRRTRRARRARPLQSDRRR